MTTKKRTCGTKLRVSFCFNNGFRLPQKEIRRPGNVVVTQTSNAEGHAVLDMESHTSPTRVKKTKGRSKRKKTNNYRQCACGDMYCNTISRFLGSVIITGQCSYCHPSDGTTKKASKRKRSRAIHNEVIKWRNQTNCRFTHQVSKEPSSRNIRFNEIHYPIMFLNKFRGSRKIPESIKMEFAKQTDMYRSNLVTYCKHLRKAVVLVVPTLSAHQAIQVTNNIVCARICFLFV